MYSTHGTGRSPAYLWPRDSHGLRETIGSKNEVKEALQDNIETAIEDQAWMKCTLVQEREHFHVNFRPALRLAL